MAPPARGHGGSEAGPGGKWVTLPLPRCGPGAPGWDGDRPRAPGTAGEVKGELGQAVRGHKETAGDVVKGCEGRQGEMTRGDDTGR